MDGRISNLQQVASLRRYTLTDGVGKGLDVLDCDNGKIRFLLNVSKACDVMQLYHEGQNTSFISKNGFTLREPPFGNRFEGGMLYTCGLDNVGGMRDGNPVHGSLHNIPAEIVRAECNSEGIVVEAIIRDTALFGKNLVLRRRIYSAIGSESLRLEDTLVNEGYRTENYCVLYHEEDDPLRKQRQSLILIINQKKTALAPFSLFCDFTIFERCGIIVDRADACPSK